jgi:pteridine reductase
MAHQQSDQSLEGRVAFVTGGARRIGAALSRAFHAAGASVVIHYRRSRTDAEALKAELDGASPGRVALVPGDLRDTGSLPALVERALGAWGGLDLLINNASTFYPTPLGKVTEEQWDDLVGTNLKAPLFLTQAAAPSLRARHGAVINIVDVYARRPLAHHPVYCAAKAGLAMLTWALARDLGPEIRVNGIAPGAILWPKPDIEAAEKAAILAEIPLGRAGSPAEVAACALYLARDSGYVNGQIIAVDGGRCVGT